MPHVIDIPFADNARAVEGLEPSRVWRFFASIASIPRPSGHERAIRDHVRRLAEAHGLDVRADGAGNLLLDVPATPGREAAPIVVLQAHLDMVAEQNADGTHDFETDPIRLVRAMRDGKPVLRADGTTLGADNGIGAALALAAATDPDLVHGPLEVLLTSDEEVGMTGAKALEPEFVRGRRLVNLDTEEDDAIYIGCAGGCDVGFGWELPTEPAPTGAVTATITVSGLRGGHSGAEIHLGRTNAIAAALAVADDAALAAPRLVALAGGSKRNAIPREARIALLVAPGEVAALRRAAAEATERARRAGDEGATIAVEESAAAPAVPAEASERVLLALRALPSGVLAVVPAMPDLVQTSNNLSVARTTATTGSITVAIDCLCRSSSADDLDQAPRRLEALGRLAGASVRTGNRYPGWQPDPDSALLAAARSAYRDCFDAAPRVAAIHAGLECGIICERLGGAEAISLGPNIAGAHSPEERVEIESVDRSRRLLAALLDRLSAPA